MRQRRVTLDERAVVLEVRSDPEGKHVYATGWGEGCASYLGRSVFPASGKSNREERRWEAQKSAEPIVLERGRGERNEMDGT